MLRKRDSKKRLCWQLELVQMILMTIPFSERKRRIKRKAGRKANSKKTSRIIAVKSKVKRAEKEQQLSNQMKRKLKNKMQQLTPLTNPNKTFQTM